MFSKFKLLSCLCVVLLTAACSSNSETPDDMSTDLTDEEKSQLCDEARTEAADKYNMLDQSCTQDSDCKVMPIGGCGCPVPVNVNVSVEDFQDSVSAAKQVCDEYYTAPGAQTCLNAVICDYSFLEDGELEPVCNAQGLCDEPPQQDVVEQ